MDLVAIDSLAGRLGRNWFLFHDPFTFITFWIYATCR